MAKAKPGTLVPQIVDLDVKIDKDDLAAILTSRAEGKIKSEIQTCKDQAAKLEKENKALHTQRVKLLEGLVDKHFAPTVKIMKSAASSLKCKDVKAATDAGYVGDSGAIINGTLTVTGEKPSIAWTVNAKVKVTKPAKDKQVALDANLKAADTNKQAWLDWRRKLADLPSLARRARAAIAEQRLSATAEGQDLIAMLDDNMDDGIKLLGIG